MKASAQNGLCADYAGERTDSSSNYDGKALLALSHDAELFAINAGMLPRWLIKAKGLC